MLLGYMFMQQCTNTKRVIATIQSKYKCYLPPTQYQGHYCKPLIFCVSFYIAGFSGYIFAALKFCISRTCFCRDTAGDSNHRNGRTIFAPLLFAFTYLPAKIKGTQKFRGLQYKTKKMSLVQLPG